MKTAQDIMTKNVVSVTTDTSVKDLARVLLNNNISGVPVLDKKGAGVRHCHGK